MALDGVGWVKRGVFALLLIVLSSAFAVAAVEGFIRLTGKDWALIHKALYYQQTDAHVHRISPDPFLHYELRPDSTGMAAHAIPGRSYTVHINSFGARGAERSLEKPPNTTRILFFGASTVYGFNCDDDETIPHRLEVALSKLASPPAAPPTEKGAQSQAFEVWNYGVSAYVQPQISRLARNKLKEIPEVDALVILYTNRGRRPFLGGGATLPEHLPLFAERDPLFLPENFPTPKDYPPQLHTWALQSLALYRYYYAYRRGVLARGAQNRELIASLHDSEWDALLAEAKAEGVPVFFVGYPLAGGGGSTLPAEAGMGPGKAALGMNLMALGEEPETYDVHPLPHILDDYGERIARGMVEAGVVEIDGLDLDGLERDGLERGAPENDSP